MVYSLFLFIYIFIWLSILDYLRFLFVFLFREGCWWSRNNSSVCKIWAQGWEDVSSGSWIVCYDNCCVDFLIVAAMFMVPWILNCLFISVSVIREGLLKRLQNQGTGPEVAALGEGTFFCAFFSFFSELLISFINIASQDYSSTVAVLTSEFWGN